MVFSTFIIFPTNAQSITELNHYVGTLNEIGKVPVIFFNHFSSSNSVASEWSIGNEFLTTTFKATAFCSRKCFSRSAQ